MTIHPEMARLGLVVTGISPEGRLIYSPGSPGAAPTPPEQAPATTPPPSSEKPGEGLSEPHAED